jgi:hypothetical protein
MYVDIINYTCTLLELKQKMSKGEVMALVRLKVRQAKLGMHNTKDTLMIGAMPSYCLGCGNTFPAGVNGIRASKVNHDAFSLSNATSLNDGGNKRRLKTSWRAK